MMQEYLFTDTNGRQVSQSQITETLANLGAGDAEILYVHSDMTLGLPNTALSRRKLMAGLYGAIANLGVKTLVFPVFTFSFPNGKAYDVKHSRSRMGALNEYARRLPEAVRSKDPMMSVAVIGEKRYLAEGIGHSSLGKDSTFDLLHREKNVKYLFLGVHPGACFTYTHYVEWALHVPYRYDREFTGIVMDKEGRPTEETYSLFVRYNGVVPQGNDLPELLAKAEVMRSTPLGDNYAYVIEGEPAFEILAEQIRSNPHYMVAYTEPLTYDKTFVLTKEMVAL